MPVTPHRSGDAGHRRGVRLAATTWESCTAHGRNHTRAILTWARNLSCILPFSIVLCALPLFSPPTTRSASVRSIGPWCGVTTTWRAEPGEGSVHEHHPHSHPRVRRQVRRARRNGRHCPSKTRTDRRSVSHSRSSLRSSGVTWRAPERTSQAPSPPTADPAHHR